MITGEFILLLIITLLNVFLWVVFFVKLKNNLSPQRILSDIKQEVEKLLIEINKTVSDDITIIDDRAKKTKEIIDDCEKKMALYYAQEQSKHREADVLHRLDNSNKISSKGNEVAKKYQRNASRTDSVIESDTVQLSIDFENYNVTNQSFVSEEDSSVVNDIPEITTIEDSPIKEVPFKRKVLQLAANDYSVETIAQKLGCTETEVQIILDLFL